MNAARPVITVLTPVYNESEGLETYVETVRRVLLNNEEFEFRILFVEDGSFDDSWAQIKKVCEADPRFCGLRLSRNFGSHIAMTAGFAAAEGDAIATLACDLQDPPETILEFARAWQGGAQIVWGHRRSREDAWWRALTSRLFFKLISKFAMPRGSKFATGSFFLVDREVADCFNDFPEQNRITFALVAWTGFGQAVVHYDRKPRLTGVSGWSFSKMLKAMYDTFVGFSLLPVRVITTLGVLFFFVALGLAGHVMLNWYFGDPVKGWSGIMFAMALFLGIQFMVLGVMSEYLSRIYSEVVRRPLYFIQDRAGDDVGG